jgi:signal transduction histidine kinase
MAPSDRHGSAPGASNPDAQIQAYQRQLRRLALELSLAEARERREIASDLHDHIGQALAYVVQKVTKLQGNAVFSGMEEDFSEILQILNQTIRYTRDLTVEISPSVLYELGLPAALEWLAERAERRYDYAVSYTQTGTPQAFSEGISVLVFKAVQELLANAAKHARPSTVRLHSKWRSDGLEISVEDDGRGFDSGAIEDKLTRGDCFGLFNIRERMSGIGGRMSIESAPGQGTRVTLATSADIKEEGRDDPSASR